MKRRRSAIAGPGPYILGMDSITSTFERSAFSDATLRTNPGAIAGKRVFDAGKRRDARTRSHANVAISALVRTDQGGRLACIRNLSSRGLTLSMAKPPRRGEFVEIVAQGRSLVGQVEWVSDCHAGIALRETIDVEAMLRGEGGPVAAKPQAYRKAPARPAAGAIFTNSGIVARQLQFAAIVAVGACAALLIALCVHDLLTDVFDQIRMGLAR